MLVALLGISYDRAVKFHRFLGYYTLLFVILHFILASQDASITSFEALDSGVTPGWGLLAFIGMAFLFVTAGVLVALRRKLFEAFKYAHYAFIPTAIFVILHVPEKWPYAGVPLGVYVLDGLYRWSKSLKTASAASLRAHVGGITTLSLPISKALLEAKEPGSYYFVCVPEVSIWEWHPISACASELVRPQAPCPLDLSTPKMSPHFKQNRTLCRAPTHLPYMAGRPTLSSTLTARMTVFHRAWGSWSSRSGVWDPRPGPAKSTTWPR